MDGNPRRLVQRVQRELQSIGSGDASGGVALSDVEELQVRVRSLQGLDDEFVHVGLSRYVTQAGVTPVPGCVRGEYVATEA